VKGGFIMTNTYTQYFTGHVYETQRWIKEAKEETLHHLAEVIPMSDENKLDLDDSLTSLHSRCCTESFALGIEIGLRIAWEFSAK